MIIDMHQLIPSDFGEQYRAHKIGELKYAREQAWPRRARRQARRGEESLPRTQHRSFSLAGGNGEQGEHVNNLLEEMIQKAWP